MFGEVQAAHRLMRRSALFFGNCNRNAGEETRLEKNLVMATGLYFCENFKRCLQHR